MRSGHYVTRKRSPESRAIAVSDATALGMSVASRTPRAACVVPLDDRGRRRDRRRVPVPAPVPVPVSVPRFRGQRLLGSRPPAGAACARPRRRPGRVDLRPVLRASGLGAGLGESTSGRCCVRLASALAWASRPPAGAAYARPRRRPGRGCLRPVLPAPGLGAGLGEATSGRCCERLASALAWARRPPAGAAYARPRRRPRRGCLRPVLRAPGLGAGLGESTSGRRCVRPASAPARSRRPPADVAPGRWPTPRTRLEHCCPPEPCGGHIGPDCWPGNCTSQPRLWTSSGQRPGGTTCARPRPRPGRDGFRLARAQRAPAAGPCQGNASPMRRLSGRPLAPEPAALAPTHLTAARRRGTARLVPTPESSS